jgi:hypothetical protein
VISVFLWFVTGTDDAGAAQSGSETAVYEFRLDEAVPDDHLVRQIASCVDLSWVYAELAPYYSAIGRPSIDPVLMIRMLIIGQLSVASGIPMAVWRLSTAIGLRGYEAMVAGHPAGTLCPR